MCTCVKFVSSDLCYLCVCNKVFQRKFHASSFLVPRVHRDSNIVKNIIMAFFYKNILKCNTFLWIQQKLRCKVEFSASLLQSLVSRDLSEIVLICWFVLLKLDHFLRWIYCILSEWKYFLKSDLKFLHVHMDPNVFQIYSQTFGPVACEDSSQRKWWMQLKSSLSWLTWDEVTRASPAAQSFYSKLFKWLCWTAVVLLSGNIIQFPAA